MNSILFIEDDLPLALGVEYILKKEGFGVVYAKNLKEGRKSFESNNCDLILLDVMLPDGNGYDFCKEIRSKSDIPVIFITACDEEANVVLGLDMGGDDYVTKPVRIKELVSRINAVMRRKGIKIKKKEDKIVTGDIELEPLRYKVYKRGEELLLTSAEYKLLLILIENNGNVIERNLIIEKLWDVDENFVDANSLNVYIRRLREKIEDDVKEPTYIETLRGIGYRWCKEVKHL